MKDVVFLSLVVAVFAINFAFLCGCEQLASGRSR